jgi:putative acetyltransferase
MQIAMWEIVQAEDRKDCETAKSLIVEYTASLDINFDFQHLHRELQEFPGHYAPPRGRVLLAKSGNQIAGCVCFRHLTNDVCEMKRLYVKPEYRGQAIGKRLALAVIREAKTIGYHCMRLDTLPTMSAAKALYQTLGFTRIEPYYDNPVEGALFFELKL